MDNKQNLDGDRIPNKIKWASPSKPIIFPQKTKMSQENEELLKKIKAYRYGMF